jgi:hypothetical protein
MPVVGVVVADQERKVFRSNSKESVDDFMVQIKYMDLGSLLE